MVKFVNLTPHDINVRLGEQEFVFPASGKVARVAVTQQPRQPIVFNGVEIPVVSTEFGEVEGLPESKEGVIYIVSALVLTALKGSRADVVAPDTGRTCIRDDKGHIVAITQFTI